MVNNMDVRSPLMVISHFCCHQGVTVMSIRDWQRALSSDWLDTLLKHRVLTTTEPRTRICCQIHPSECVYRPERVGDTNTWRASPTHNNNPPCPETTWPAEEILQYAFHPERFTAVVRAALGVEGNAAVPAPSSFRYIGEYRGKPTYLTFQLRAAELQWSFARHVEQKPTVVLCVARDAYTPLEVERFASGHVVEVVFLDTVLAVDGGAIVARTRSLPTRRNGAALMFTRQGVHDLGSTAPKPADYDLFIDLTEDNRGAVRLSSTIREFALNEDEAAALLRLAIAGSAVGVSKLFPAGTGKGKDRDDRASKRIEAIRKKVDEKMPDDKFRVIRSAKKTLQNGERSYGLNSSITFAFVLPGEMLERHLREMGKR
jgi:hypothetical protein